MKLTKEKIEKLERWFSNRIQVRFGISMEDIKFVSIDDLDDNGKFVLKAMGKNVQDKQLFDTVYPSVSFYVPSNHEIYINKARKIRHL